MKIFLAKGEVVSGLEDRVDGYEHRLKDLRVSLLGQVQEVEHQMRIDKSIRSCQFFQKRNSQTNDRLVDVDDRGVWPDLGLEVRVHSLRPLPARIRRPATGQNFLKNSIIMSSYEKEYFGSGLSILDGLDEEVQLLEDLVRL